MDTPIIPHPSAHNPGKGSELTIAFTNGEEKWQEIIDLNQILSDILMEGGYTAELEDRWLILNQRLALLPQFLDFNLDEEGTAQTSSTIEIRAVSGLFIGVFEYQHARSEESVAASFRSGFSRWVQVDLVVLLDAIEDEPRNCSMMKMSFNEEQGLERRILLGPVEHYCSFGTCH